jgi:hypothetical protein
MSRASCAESDWKAPAEDGQVLLWPSGGAIIEQTRANLNRLASANDVCIGGVPLAELRRRQRQWIGHSDQRPIVATGHQIELAHPGVWVKDVVINELAHHVEGEAYHLAVDTDSPKHLLLRWPGASFPISDDPALTSAQWSGAVAAPSPRHLSELTAAFESAARGWGFAPLLGRWLDSVRRLILESQSLTWVLSNAMHRLDWELGLRHHLLLASPLWASPPYALFVHHILARAGQFATLYNRILADYRRQNAIDNPGRPWPDLEEDGHRCEVPFWLDQLADGRRTRASVQRRGRAWALCVGDEALELEAGADGWAAAENLVRFLADRSLRLSPRAVTLTAFMRLLVCDQFVHGIGGARYDQVTDRVIGEFFGVEPPAFSVATATLLFPTAADEQRVDIRALELEGRRLRHAWADPAKRRKALQIAGAPRNSAQRRRLFSEMHAELTRILSSAAYEQWRRRLAEAQRIAERQRTVFDRELFYAIQPAGRLWMLIKRIGQAVGGC